MPIIWRKEFEKKPPQRQTLDIEELFQRMDEFTEKVEKEKQTQKEQEEESEHLFANQDDVFTSDDPWE